jgi:hypothetical protein
MNFKSDSLKAIAPAIVKAQKAMGSALKDAKNPFFKSKFADLNSVIDAALPTFHDNNIAILQLQDITTNGILVVQTVLLHESGEFIGSNTAIIVAKQNDPQALGSAISYARRYGLQSAVTLKAVDDDAEAGMGRVVKPIIETAVVPLPSPREISPPTKPSFRPKGKTVVVQEESGDSI